MLKTTMIFMSFLGFIQPVISQSVIEPLSGYRPILEKIYEKRHKVDSVILDSMLQTVLSSENRKRNVLIPLEMVNISGDTTILFINSRDVYKIYKRKHFNFTIYQPSKLEQLAVHRLQKAHALHSLRFNMDSVYQLMKSNIAVNSEIFTMDRYLDSAPENFCCKPKDTVERFWLIYYFFRNGIILVNRSYSGTLHFVAF
jgi:hypothetical protein